MHDVVMQSLQPNHSLPAGRDWLALAGSLLVVFVAAAIGGFGTRSAPEFYAQLSLASWAPPAWLFGPAWTVLYTMMGVAAWLVWRAPGRHGVAIGLFGAQLVPNMLWGWFFFAWRQGGLASADIVVLDVLVVMTLIAFWRVRPLAGMLLVPYLAWISFATALSFSTWQRNPGLL